MFEKAKKFVKRKAAEIKTAFTIKEAEIKG